jgi:hypothetical protein
MFYEYAPILLYFETFPMQGSLAEGEGSVQLTSSLRYLFVENADNIFDKNHLI